MTKPDLRSLTFSVTQARAQLGRIVDLAAQGHAVQLTRRGRTVAVLVPEQQASAPTPSQGGWFQFSVQWRELMQQEGLAFMSDEELQAMRSDPGSLQAPPLKGVLQE